MIQFALASAACILIAVVPGARRVPFFVLITISLHALVSTGAWMLAGRFGPLMVALQGATALHLWSLLRGHTPPSGWRELISLPASWFIDGVATASTTTMTAMVTISSTRVKPRPNGRLLTDGMPDLSDGCIGPPLVGLERITRNSR